MTAERIQSIALDVTAQAREETLERMRALRTTSGRLSRICQRAGVPTAHSADSLIERIQDLEERVPSTDFLRCTLLVGEAQDVVREALDSVDSSLSLLFREQERCESKVRTIIREAATRRSRSVKAADKTLDRNLGLARARSTRVAHGNAVCSLWFQFITFGGATGLIGALIAMRLPSDNGQQEQGLWLALILGLALPLALYAVVKCQNPGLDDWLHLMEEREFAREYPRKAEVLQRARQAAVDLAERKYKELAGGSLREIAIIRSQIDALNALREHVKSLRDQIAV